MQVMEGIIAMMAGMRISSKSLTENEGRNMHTNLIYR